MTSSSVLRSNVHVVIWFCFIALSAQAQQYVGEWRNQNSSVVLSILDSDRGVTGSLALRDTHGSQPLLAIQQPTIVGNELTFTTESEGPTTHWSFQVDDINERGILTGHVGELEQIFALNKRIDEQHGDQSPLKRFLGKWEIRKSPTTGRVNLTVDIVQGDTISGTVKFLDPDGTTTQWPIIHAEFRGIALTRSLSSDAEFKGPKLDFQTLDHDTVVYWSLTLTNATTGFLRGDERELLIEEKVKKKR